MPVWLFPVCPMTRTDLLQLLADGEFHSGQKLADDLGVSRTAVWKQLRKLEDSGLLIESVKARGYRLPGGLELLNEQRIRAALQGSAKSLLRKLVLAEVTDSTNAEIFRQLEVGEAASGLVCAAEQQTAGRGRRGRSWVSPFAGNLYLSLAWQFAGGAAVLEGLSLAVGVAASTALADLDFNGISLKWPNDLLYDDAKLGGILIEMTGDAAGSCQVVVGIGINVKMPDRAAQAIAQSWTDLERIGGAPLCSRNTLLAALLNHLLPLLNEFEEQGFAPWRERWMALDAYLDQPVIVSSGNRRMTGAARGIDGSGALLLDTSSGMLTVRGGEVSLRRAP